MPQLLSLDIPTFTIACLFAPDADTQLYQTLKISAGTTIKQAVEHLGWQTRYPDIFSLEVGIFSKKVGWDTPLKQGDRIEIYRPLTLDPITRRSLKRDLKKKQRLS